MADMPKSLVRSGSFGILDNSNPKWVLVEKLLVKASGPSGTGPEEEESNFQFATALFGEWHVKSGIKRGLFIEDIKIASPSHKVFCNRQVA